MLWLDRQRKLSGCVSRKAGKPRRLRKLDEAQTQHCEAIFFDTGDCQLCSSERVQKKCVRCEIFCGVYSALEAIKWGQFWNQFISQLPILQNRVYGVLELGLLVSKGKLRGVESSQIPQRASTSLWNFSLRFSGYEYDLPFRESLWTLALSFSRSADILICMAKSILSSIILYNFGRAPWPSCYSDRVSASSGASTTFQ